MSEPKLTAFQNRTEERVRRLLEQHGRQLDAREVIEADVPFYSDNPEIAVKIVAGDLEIWLYDDEASYSIAGQGQILEKPDYDNQDQLAETLLLQLAEVLSRGKVGP